MKEESPIQEDLGEMTIRIKKWTTVGYWKWDTENEDCPICLMPMDGCCSACSLPGDSCPPVTGICGHSCHAHCMSKWLQTQETCPKCRAKWSEQVV